ncbi:glycoside hydrolase family 73 protein [Kosakonia pseudosacchari]|uniref:glycoside hydrolase family 73 protein n=1 Tax=Kosakonia pseudosacchari TaxID=1646340 RepID=UPI000A3C6D76|nr:glucosaminidase domain-containing protein [Kosakonia pseudosacchari]
MKICFPARKANGGDYADLQEIMDVVGREPHGSWLADTNNMWHGGIHLTELTAPDAVLREDNADKAVPLQCMADGEVVAWRINDDYLTRDYLGSHCQYSTTFLLVKSPFQADSTKPESGLDVYSLYMGLAPVSVFPVHKVMQARETVLMRKAGRYAGSESSDGRTAVPERSGHVVAGGRVLILKEAQFSNDGVVQPFGLAKKLNDKGEAHGDCFWVTLLPEYMAEVSEQRLHLPAWMQVAVTHGIYNSVVVPPSPVHINAGDAVGFLAEDIAPIGMAKTSASHFAHIEVLSVDTRMPDILTNPGNTDTGTRFIRLGLHKRLYLRTGDKFEPMSAITGRDGGKLLEREKCHPTVSNGKTWYQIRPHTWMCGDDVDEVRQFDLAERGFSALIENTTSDMKNSLKESWIRDALVKFAERMNPEKGMRQGAMSRYYKGMVNKFDADHDGMLSVRELFEAMHHPEMGIRCLSSRLVIKHDSEWYGGSTHHKWDVFFQNYDLLRTEYAKKWLDDSEWMSQVSAFSSGAAVWHMHPVVFLDAINIKLNSKKLVGTEFVRFVFNEAKKNELLSHVPAAITTAQAILETGYGKSVPVDIYSGEYSNNLFGIKAHGEPSFVWVNTHEFVNGVKTPIVDKFMKYNSYEESISGRSDFFVKNKRYHFLFDYTDPCDWARGLQHAGYATDPDYADKLIKIMKREKLL